jgi:F-type H+-transporting ATPase subunit delta
MINQNNGLISKRWAKALIELAQEDENISKRDMLDDLREISETINSSEDLKNVISNPSISVEEKQVVLCKLFQNSIMPIVYNFVYTLNLKKRVDIIGDIADEFQKELEKIEHVTHVSVTSAIDLADERKEDIKQKISNKLQKEVIVDWKVDKEIIAGLVLNINETIIDNSVKHKLEDLTKTIIKG